jgi:phosphotriesterase-related protein
MELLPGSVMTVLGPIDGGDLGVTLPHEHLLMELDWPGLWPGTSPTPHLVDAPVSMELLGLHRRDPFVTRDNLRLLDPILAARELTAFAAAGGSTIVECSTTGLGKKRDQLPEISRRSGVQIVAGAGWYVGSSHPEGVVDSSIEVLCERLVTQLDDTLDGVRPGTVRAGVIGEIGTSGPLTDGEEKVLRAAVRAHRRTGAGISVHLSSKSQGRAVLRIVRLLDEEGANPERVVLGHMCMGIARRYRTLAAQAGYGLEFDTFGYEGYYMLQAGTYASIWEEPRDSDRIRMILDVLEMGRVNQVFMSQDVYTKTALKAFGGYGYDHLLTNVFPMLKRAGVDDESLRVMTVDNPRRLLAKAIP